jgi:quercetin dioxygenase-like cupin family protein
MSTVLQQPRTQYVYDFSLLDRVPDGPTSAQVTARRLVSGATLETAKSSTVAAALTGRNLIMLLARQTRGTGAKAHTHPNEQFNYIVSGVMTGELGGETIFAPAGTLGHTPANIVHTGLACPDEDLIFVAMKDTRHGLSGPPVDGRHDGPACLPGFGSRAGEPKKTTAELISELGRDPSGVKRRFVYDYAALVGKPGRESNAKVTSGIGAGTWSGDLITGETLHVARLRSVKGHSGDMHSHPNEQFVFVLEGAIAAEIDGEEQRLGRHCALHVPPDMPHRIGTSADQDALIIILQDTKHPFAG